MSKQGLNNCCRSLKQFVKRFGKHAFFKSSNVFLTIIINVVINVVINVLIIIIVIISRSSGRR